MCFGNDLVGIQRVLAQQLEEGEHQILLCSSFGLSTAGTIKCSLSVRNQASLEVITHVHYLWAKVVPPHLRVGARMFRL